jgi:hypothetical protein
MKELTRESQTPVEGEHLDVHDAVRREAES